MNFFNLASLYLLSSFIFPLSRFPLSPFFIRFPSFSFSFLLDPSTHTLSFDPLFFIFQLLKLTPPELLLFAAAAMVHIEFSVICLPNLLLSTAIGVPFFLLSSSLIRRRCHLLVVAVICLPSPSSSPFQARSSFLSHLFCSISSPTKAEIWNVSSSPSLS
ncbi:hypothetical protein Lser_V15G43092 [Lactuca serriola]